jgi:hypothetical protein
MRQWPYFFYRETALTGFTQSIFFPLPNGINYVLKRIAAVYPDAGGGVPSPVPQIGLFYGERGQPLQQELFSVNLVATPGEVAAPLASGERKILYKFDYLFVVSGIIRIDIGPAIGGNPSRIRLMIEGTSVLNYESRAVE